MASLRSFILFIFASLFLSANGDSSDGAVIGSFGPIATFQPVENWLYPSGEGVPVSISLGNASLAFAFGFQMAYGISMENDPGNYIFMDSLLVNQYEHMFNFTGNLLSNAFWWNFTTPVLADGQYILTSSAAFTACTPGTPNGFTAFLDSADIVQHTVLLTNHFTVGQGGTIPANTTGNNLALGNSSAITAGMYDCTALKDAKIKVTGGMIGTYAAGIIFTAIVMTVVRGKDKQT